MKLVLLPGLDGTGLLFRPLLEVLPFNIITQVITYPTDRKLGYQQLLDYIAGQLPKEDFVLLGESFSGPLAYQVALSKPSHLKAVIFVASFLENPRPILLTVAKFLPLRYVLSLPLPDFLIRYFLFGESTSQTLIDLFRKVLKLVPADTLSFRLSEIRRLSPKYMPSNIKAKYLQASEDKLVPDHSGMVFKQVFKNLDIQEVEGSHFLLQTKPKDCAKIIEHVISHYAHGIDDY